jgi:nicotinate-nucleotide pyrophosphorylase (carboxylating)
MKKLNLPELDWAKINSLIDMSLDEDIKTGDATSISVIPENVITEARFVTREKCVCAGLEVAKTVFIKIDNRVSWTSLVKDGDILEPGAVLASVRGNARSLLTAERTALNFLQRLCGIATTTLRYVDAAGSSDTKILDTRKTTPGWRSLEKYAVAAGGGTNHRVGLYDRIMVKDNHRELAGLEGEGGIARSVKRARETFPALEVEIEADNLNEVKEASEAGADYILLDNMTNEQMEEAIKINKGRSKLEASGGITIERIPSIAKIGVDFISVGALTHSVKAIDISLEM